MPVIFLFRLFGRIRTDSPSFAKQKGHINCCKRQGLPCRILPPQPEKSTCYCKYFFQFYSPNGEFYCYAVIYGFQPSDIALRQLKRRIEYHCDEVAISLLPQAKISHLTKWGISQSIPIAFAVGYFYVKKGGWEPQVYKSEVCGANERRAKLGSTRSHQEKIIRNLLSSVTVSDFLFI